MSKTTLDLDLMVIIINRGKSEKLPEVFAEHGLTFQLMTLGKGTADKKHLSYLGLGETEKSVLFCTMTHCLARHVLKKLDSEKSLRGPGKGIAFTIPINKGHSNKVQKRIQGISTIEEAYEVNNEHEYDMILAVCNQGYAEDVMFAAKAAGATGGTVMHARGIGLKEAEKFFGISIQPEKDMLFILVNKETRQAILEAISSHEGNLSESRTIAFSLPVNGVAGLFNGFTEKDIVE